MVVLKGLVDGVVDVAVVDAVERHAGQGARQLVELARQVLALLVGALGGGGQRRELAVDLAEQLAQLVEVERAAVVGVELLEQLVQAAQLRGRLGELLAHPRRHLAPVFKRQLHVLGVLVALPRYVLHEAQDVVRYVVLHRRAVADGVDVAERRRQQAQVGVGFERVLVRLAVEFLGDGLTEGVLRDAGRPEAEAHRELLCDGFVVFILDGEEDSVGLDFLHAGVRYDVDRVVRKASLWDM